MKDIRYLDNMKSCLANYPVLLCEGRLSIGVHSDEIQSTAAACLDLDVRCQALQDGGDHFARAAPAVESNGRLSRYATMQDSINVLRIEVDKDDLFFVCDGFLESLLASTSRVGSHGVDHDNGLIDRELE